MITARCHPNEHVNMGQSTNDVYPTALKIASWFGVNRLIAAMATLRGAFADKAAEFADILKMGRTQIAGRGANDAGPRVWHLCADAVGRRNAALRGCDLDLRDQHGRHRDWPPASPLTPPMAALVREKLADIAGVPAVTAIDLIEATQDCGAFVQLSGVLKRVAVKLSKICNDLRLLSLWPARRL